MHQSQLNNEICENASVTTEQWNLWECISHNWTI